MLQLQNINMNSNIMFAMIHFLKLYYNVFILENKIDIPMFRKICVKMCYITLEIALVCVNMERVSSSVFTRYSCPWSYYVHSSSPDNQIIVLWLLRVASATLRHACWLGNHRGPIHMSNEKNLLLPFPIVVSYSCCCEYVAFIQRLCFPPQGIAQFMIWTAQWMT
jgi:hypothetical protein